MADHEKLTPEEADVRNQAMLQDLEHMYTPVDEAQSLERIRNRLLATEHSSSFNSIQPTRQLMRKTQQERFQTMNSMHVPIAHKKVRYLNILAASIVAALIIGSLLFEVTRVYQSNTGGSGNSHISASGGTITPVSTSIYGPDWKILATFKGKGSTDIQNLHLKSKYALGAYFICAGEGNVNLVIGKIGLGATCRSVSNGVIDVWKGAYVLEKINIIVAKNSSWQLELANCVGNEQTCNSSGFPMPTSTPAPSLAPTPPPTVFPAPMPTVTPIPTPTVSAH